MKVDTVITLENDVNCLLLEETTYANEKYFLAVVLNEEEEPSDNYVVLKEYIENDEQYVIRISDLDILTKLVNLFTIKIDLPENESAN